MRDERTGLKKGTILTLDDKEYSVVKEIGRGASCIVYEATYVDTKDLKHIVRIKEFFPYDVNIERQDSVLVVAPNHEEKYNILKKQFEEAYEKNVEIKKLAGLVNYTVDSIETYNANNTVYSIMTTIEGQDYASFQDKELCSVFAKANKLCSILNIYHDKGYLHLDIKPENLLITKESMYLFDFDSLISKKEVNGSGSLRISYSHGFSAPELVRGDRKAISEATDVFSVGAIIFYKMFNRVPELEERKREAHYNYDEISKNYEEIEYPRKFYKKLDEFFHKTLASASVSRYQNMKDVSDVLQDLEALTKKQSLLIDNFQDNYSNFVGREEELEEIETAFENSNVVFLSGMGGIGKTELAKQIATKMRREGRIDRVAFLNFETSLANTICSHDLEFTYWDEDYTNIGMDTVDKKIRKLEEVTREPEVYGGDLIIVDNFDEFDVEQEFELLLQFVNCKAKFLFTTRKENIFRDLDFKEINVRKMSNIKNLLNLFQIYNMNHYRDDEMEKIVQIIEFVDRHTMTVDLIAKYLRRTEELPSKFFAKLLEKEGITNTDNSKIAHKKISKKPIASVNQHLQALFDLSGFSKGEATVLTSLSFFGAVKIKRSLFRHLLTGIEVNSFLNKLIRDGWIEDDGEKISLHQIILDLIFNFFVPEQPENNVLIKNLCNYCEENTDSYIQKKNKEKLVTNFIERVHYTNLDVAILYLKYFQYIEKDENYLKKAGFLCEKYNTTQGLKLRLEIICEEIKYLLKKYEIDILDDENDYEFKFGQMFKTAQSKMNQYFAVAKKIILKRFPYADRNNSIALELSKYNSKDSYQSAVDLLFKYRVWGGCDFGSIICDEIIKMYYFLYQALRTLEKDINSECFWCACEGIQSMYYETQTLLDFILGYISHENITYAVQEKVYSEAAEFYGIDYCEELRYMYVRNHEKSALYAEKQRNLFQENRGGFLITGINYFDAAESEKYNGNYDKAYKLFEIAFEKHEITEDVFLYEKAEYFLHNRQFDSALVCLDQVLVYDDVNALDSFYTKQKIVDLYRQWGKKEDAIKLCDKLITERKKENKTDETIKDILCLITKKRELQNRKWYKYEEMHEIHNHLEMLSANTVVASDLLHTHLMYFESLIKYKSLDQAIEWLFPLAEKYRIRSYMSNNNAIELYSKIVAYEEYMLKNKVDLYIKSLLWLLDLRQEGFSGIYNEGLRTVAYVKKLLTQNPLCEDYEYCYALLMKVKTRFYSDSMDYTREEYEADCKACDYYILTERTLQEGSVIGHTYESWKECFRNSMDAKNIILSEKALNAMQNAVKTERYPSKKDKTHDEVDYHLSYMSFQMSYGRNQKVKDEILIFLEESMDDDNYCWCMGFNEVKSILVEIGEIIPAVVFSAYGILKVLDYSSNYDSYVRELFDKNMNNLFLQVFPNLLPKAIEEKNKDDVISILEFIIRISENNDYLAQIKKICQVTLKRYGSSDVEFKH